MAALFLDSSALVKRYISESGSHWVHAIADPAATNRIHIAYVAGAEVVAAIARRQRVGGIDAQTAAIAIGEFRDDWNLVYRRLALSLTVVEAAMMLAETRALRGYDAIQLGTALTLEQRYRQRGGHVTFVSADDDLNAAAFSEGMAVENPNQH